MVNRLSPSELYLLSGLTKSMLAFVREHDEEAGDIFHGSALDVDDDEVHQVLGGLLNKVNAAGGASNISDEQINDLFQGKGVEVWARCAHTMFMNCEPRLVPESCFEELVSAGSSTSKVGAVVQKMPETSKQALGELCAMINDSSLDAECTAMSIAGSILLPPGVGGKKDAAKKLMTFLVLNNADVFGASKRGRAGSALAPTGDNGGSQVNKKERRQRDALVEFYEWRDPLCVKVVDRLFDNYEFVKIAQGLQQRYGALPAEFVLDLEEMLTDPKQAIELDWFKSNKAVAKKGKRFSLLPRINSRPSSRRSYKPQATDRIIDELIETEVKYQGVMGDLRKDYVEKILAIAEGKSGEAARKELGISPREIEEIFGARVTNVLDLSNVLLAELSVVSVVSSPPRSTAGRAGLVAEIFAEQAPSFKVYAPYISSHMGAVRQLKGCLAKLEQAEKLSMGKSAGKLLSSQAAKKERQSFDKLWNELSRNSPNLKGHTLASILINPVQRVPRYKLFLETLDKEVAKADAKNPAVPLVKSSLESIKEIATQINKAVKQHSKLEQLFGEDNMLNPNNSVVRRDEKGRFDTIMNSYV